MAKREHTHARFSSDAPLAGASGYEISDIPGLPELWQQTQGDERVCVAVLDGPVDLRHTSLRHLAATTLETVVSTIVDDGTACRHGTLIASVIFGRHDGPVRGLAPNCRGLIVPIFASSAGGSLRPCSQLDLARAIAEAVRQGALTTLGMAQYRLGMLTEGLDTLTRAARLNNSASLDPVNLAAQAMTRFRLGQKNEAVNQLHQLRALLQAPNTVESKEARNLLLEASRVIEQTK